MKCDYTRIKELTPQIEAFYMRVSLTTRQEEVCKILISSGAKTYAELAQRLGISHNATYRHIAGIMKKIRRYAVFNTTGWSAK